MAHILELHHISVQTQLVLEGCKELEDTICKFAAGEVNQDAHIDDNTVHEVVESITERLYEAIQPCIQKIVEGLREIHQHHLCQTHCLTGT